MARAFTSGLTETASSGQFGSADALYEMGLKYAVGRDVRCDLVEAHKWFNLAALRGNETARRYRTELSREMSRDEVAMAQRLAREWLTQH